jgi:hypothetical protein
MRFALPLAAALLFGFLVGHGTEAPVDLFILLTSIIIVYSAIGISDLLQSVPNPLRHRAAPRTEGRTDTLPRIRS